MIHLSKNLYRYPSTCNVYILRSGDQAILIDFGDGRVLQELPALGVRQVSDILVTHHHRDQVQGLKLAVEAGARVWAPHQEQDLVANVEANWQAREIFNNYNVRQDRFSLLESIPLAGTLHDYAHMTLGGYKLTVAPTPGHTPGSLSLLVEMDGWKAAFTGDLISEPGKVCSMAALQWTYNGAEGAAASIASLLDLKSRQPDVLLPSHGGVLFEPGEAIDLLVERLYALLQARGENPSLKDWLDHPYHPITPHLLLNRTSLSNSYVLLSESGQALLIDYGYDFMTGFAAGSDRAARRPWLYSLTALKREYGVSQIEVVVPTHYHDDHVAGLNLLRDVEGTQVWAAENFAHILQDPACYNLPCLWFDPIPVDRTLAFGQPVRWHEYALELFPLPGHTKYAAAIAFQADGQRFLATGDQYQRQGEDWNYVYQNGFSAEDYRQSAELYRQLKPDCLLTGHWGAQWVKDGYFDSLIRRGALLESLHQQLLSPDMPGWDAGQVWASIHPYQAELYGGRWTGLEVEITNPFDRAEQAEVRLICPPEWQVAESVKQVQLPAGAKTILHFQVAPPAGAAIRRARLAADLTVGGRRFGQVAECLRSVNHVSGTPLKPGSNKEAL